MRRPEHLAEGPLAAPAELGGVAVFFDVENILLGIQGDFDVRAVARFLAERGDVMTLRAYADWGRYRRQQRQFLEEGVQMVFLPTYGQSDKNRTDTAICVDAMEILFTRPQIETFCIVSGDSDFSILAQRLRDHGRRVIGVSAKSAASPILVKQCHEFVFYETLVGQRVVGFSVEEGEERLRRALERVVEEHGQEFHASALKDWMRKQDPTFSERNYGASSFTRFLANYEHLVTVLDGGRMRAGTTPVTPPAGPPSEGAPKPRFPTLAPKVEAEARAVLLRTIVQAALDKGGTPVPLSRLKDTMQAVAPDFDEWALGFKTFTQFLLAYPDIVVVDRATNSARPHEAIVPELSERAPADAPERDRRRRPKKVRADAPSDGEAGATAPQAEQVEVPKAEPPAKLDKAEAPAKLDKPEPPAMAVAAVKAEAPAKLDKPERVERALELPLGPPGPAGDR